METPVLRTKLFGRQFVSRRDVLMLLLGVIITLSGVKVGELIRNAQTPLRSQTTGITIPWIPATVKRWQPLIEETGKKYNVDANFIAIVMTLESGGYSKADSGEARGLMQITSPTAKDIAAKFLKQPVASYNVTDPRTNVEFGAAYIAYLRDEFGTTRQGPSWDSTIELVAAGYNGGPGAANRVEQGRGLEDTQTVVYSRDAFNMWRERHAAKSPTYDRWLERGGSELIDKAKIEKN